MSRRSERSELVFDLGGSEVCYKRLLHPGAVLALRLNRDQRCYVPSVVDLEIGSESEWPVDGSARILAHVLPVTHAYSDGRPTESGAPIFLAPSVWPSPVGDRVLWYSAGEHWVMAELSSGRTVEAPDDWSVDYWGFGPRRFAWFADGSRWVEAIPSSTWKTFSRLDVYSRANAYVESVPIRGVRRGQIAGMTRGGEFVFCEEITQPGVVRPGIAEIEVPVHFIEVASSRHRRRRAMPTLPADHVLCEARVSPDGTALAWLLEREHQPQIRILLEDLETGNVRVMAEFDEPGHFQARVRDIEWTPDSASLMYLRQNALYRLRVGGQ